jgi:hypothetical protein
VSRPSRIRPPAPPIHPQGVDVDVRAVAPAGVDRIVGDLYLPATTSGADAPTA